MTIEASSTTAFISATYDALPVDHRCRYWAKILRANQDLPSPEGVFGANDLPSGFLRNGDVELFAGDVLIEGEELNHKKSRGWAYHGVIALGTEDKFLRFQYTADTKKAMKAGGLPANLLLGSGDVAGLVRIAHALRLRISPWAEGTKGRAIVEAAWLLGAIPVRQLVAAEARARL